MSDELVLSPAGHLLLQRGEGDDLSLSDPWGRRVAAAFAGSPSAGLFALAATRPELPPSPLFAFWRDFAGRYLAQLCHTPEASDKTLPVIDPPTEAELATLTLSAPPMRGGEYLNPDIFRTLWSNLDTWVRNEISCSGISLTEWLKKETPLWQQVGRVCFHLAENKRDTAYPFAFLATYAPRISAGGQVQYQPLGKALQEYAGAQNKNALIHLLSPIQRAAERVPFVKELVESGEIYHPLAWTPGDAYPLLQNTALLEECGLLVRLPNWWQKRPRPRVSVTIGERKQTRLNTDALLDFSLKLLLGGEALTAEEQQQLLASGAGLVSIRGQWVEVDPERLREALDHWKRVAKKTAGKGLSFIEGMRLLAGAPADLEAEDAAKEHLPEWSSVQAGKWLEGILAELRDPGGAMIPVRSEHFKGQLRPYQEVGCHWLWLLSNLGLGACLADDMGLGKTVQVISLLLAIKEQSKSPGKPSLLVLPASLLANWKAEIERFAPTLTYRLIHPSEIDKGDLDAIAQDPKVSLEKTDLVLTTYGMLLRQKWLLEMNWRLAILDEAQAIKNPSANQTRAVKQLKAEARIALTGTPVENRLSDLWSIFDFLTPGLLGSSSKFVAFIKVLAQRTQDRYAPLRNLVRPYILRRMKTDKTIIQDLPDKTEMKAFCGLSRRQTLVYAQSVKEFATIIERTHGIQRKGVTLSFLMRFKQICNHPSQFQGDAVYAPEESGKFERLKTLCEEIASRQEKALIFTQFREMTEPLALFLGKVFGREGLILHGGTAVSKRRSLVEAFQKENGPPFFVLSLKAGGTGLNLTAASHVIHFDRWWNPAVENQATDRAFRIGQHRPVMVHKLICRGTIEEKIDTLIEEKLGLVNDLLKSGAEAMLLKMSNEELLKIVALDLDRATL